MRLSKAFKPSRRFRNVAASLGLVPPVLYLTAIGGLPFISVFDYPGRIHLHWVAGVVFGAWLIWKWFIRRDLAHTSIDLPILVFLITVGLSTLASTDRRLSTERCLALLAYALVFYLLLDVRSSPSTWNALLNAVIAVAGIICALGVVQIVWWYRDVVSPLREITSQTDAHGASLPRLSPLGNPNILAAYLVLVLPLGAQRCLAARRTSVRVLLGLLVCCEVVVFLLTRSRGGLLGLAAVSVAGGWLWLVRWTPGHRRRIPWAVLVLVLLLAAGGFAVFSARGLSLATESMRVRFETWRAAVLTLRDYALLGSGPGTFGARLLHYREPTHSVEIHSHAHSLYLTVGAEMGVAGLLAGLWVFVALARASLRHLRPVRVSSLAIACLVGLVGWAVHNAVDSFLDIPAIVLHVVLLAAGALPPAMIDEVRVLAVPRRLFAATLLVLLVGAGAMSVNWGFAAFHAARTAAFARDWDETRRWLDTAVARDPLNWFYGRERAFAYGHLACRDSAFLSAAVQMYGTSLEAFDDWALDHANLSVLLWRAGDPDGAIREMQRAFELEPQRALYACTLGRYLEDAARLDEAVQSYAVCVAQSPSWLQSSFWHETPWRARVLPRVVEQAERQLASPSESLMPARLQLYAGNCERAFEHVCSYSQQRSQDAPAQVERARILVCLGDLEDARAVLDRVIEQSPENGLAWLLRGQINLEQDDREEAAWDLVRSAELDPGPEVSYWLGQLAEAEGRSAQAIGHYQDALVEATVPHVTQFGPWVAHRLPLPTEQLPCLTPLRPHDAFAGPGLALGRLLAEEGRCEEATEVYRLVLLQEPGLAEAREELEQIPCAGGR